MQISPQAKAFTLIELLVVISIIALLIACCFRRCGQPGKPSMLLIASAYQVDGQLFADLSVG